jgi:hypothetical protein
MLSFSDIRQKKRASCFWGSGEGERECVVTQGSLGFPFDTFQH